MPVDYRAPNINARRLGIELQRIREALKLSYDDAAERVGCDATWLIRVETGFEQASPEEVRRLLDRYQVARRHIRDVLIDLASRPAGPGWLGPHAARVKALVRDLLTLESESPVVHTFGILLVPELVRTEPYARMCFEHRVPEVDADEEWDLLAHRQRHRPGGRVRALDVIVDESALTLITPDPEIMRGQLRRLLDLAAAGHGTVRVVPSSAGAHAGLGGSFDVLEFPDIEDRVSLTHSALGLDLAGRDLSRAWELVEDVALSPAESHAMITRVLADGG
jgi:transcriptional regulator with XRE-family HTH domain